MHWTPRRAGGMSWSLLIRTMELVFSRWKTMGREYRQPCEKRFSSLSSRQNRREQDWAWRLWLAERPGSGAREIGRVPGGRGGGRRSTGRSRGEKQGRDEKRKSG